MGKLSRIFTLQHQFGWMKAPSMWMPLRFQEKKSAGFVRARELGLAEDLEEVVEEEFGDGANAFFRHGVEAAFLIDQAVVGEYAEVRTSLFLSKSLCKIFGIYTCKCD